MPFNESDVSKRTKKIEYPLALLRIETRSEHLELGTEVLALHDTASPGWPASSKACREGEQMESRQYSRRRVWTVEDRIPNKLQLQVELLVMQKQYSMIHSSGVQLERSLGSHFDWARGSRQRQRNTIT